MGGGQNSLLTKNPAPLFSVAGPGAECERDHASCLLFEGHRPLPDVTTFQSVIEALGLLRDCGARVCSRLVHQPSQMCGLLGRTRWYHLALTERGRVCVSLSPQEVGTAQRNQLLRGSCACPLEGTSLPCFSSAQDVPPPPHVERHSRAVGVDHPLVIV